MQYNDQNLPIATEITNQNINIVIVDITPSNVTPLISAANNPEVIVGLTETYRLHNYCILLPFSLIIILIIYYSI